MATGLRGAGPRILALLLSVGLLALVTVPWSALRATPAAAAPAPPRAPSNLCSVEQWQADFRACVAKLQEVAESEVECRNAPTPGAPDAGLAGWFASRPESATRTGVTWLYSNYGYAGYSYSTYDLDNGCVSALTHPEYRFTTMVANAEFMLATAVIGAANALRERAWSPKTMWGWADPLVEQATRAIYQKVFTVFGVITLCVVGLYLIWRSRQSDMSAAMTTAGWAIVVMVAVTALAAWPVKAANFADGALVSTLGVVHDAVGPSSKGTPRGECVLPNPDACVDRRPPSVRASDTVTETMLYRNWLRGVLGSAESETAKKYGRALYDAKSFTWGEIETLRDNPNLRDATIAAKKQQWARVAQQIKAEDPEAYEYLQGTRDMERIGAGFIALLAALLFAMFDITASLLVLLGFLIFRWAVVAAPILGTIGLLRPASAGIRRLANAVVAAIFNIAIFGTGAAIYLFAVDLVMSTPTLPGWLQVVLVWLCGVVGWLLLRPYRRITQLGGKDSTAAVSGADSWHRRFFRDVQETAKLKVTDPDPNAESQPARRLQVTEGSLRPEARPEEPLPAVTRSENREWVEETTTTTSSQTTTRSTPVRHTVSPVEWSEPDVPTENAGYAIYRPDTGETVTTTTVRIRSEAR